MKKGQRRITKIFKVVEQFSYGKQLSRQKLSDWTCPGFDMEVDYKTLSGLDKLIGIDCLLLFLVENYGASNEGGRVPANREVILHTTYEAVGLHVTKCCR